MRWVARLSLTLLVVGLLWEQATWRARLAAIDREWQRVYRLYDEFMWDHYMSGACTVPSIPERPK